ncbi:MAG: SIS domain-containing protein [Clostridia bacterium]|nr:SIS domain-containing protein [Clostridia bacterium]
MSNAVEYFKNLQKILDRIISEQLNNIEEASNAVAYTLMNGGRIHAFGTGHSHMLAEEIFYRAGGLVNVNPILESSLMLHESAAKSTELERLEGYGEILFSHHSIKCNDILFLFSNSGRNGVAIDLALIAREKGVKTVVITNMEHTMKGASRHSSGKRLFEAADIVIDNCGCYGDASIEVKEINRNVAPTSTAAGAAILNAIEARAVEIMVENGYTPDVFSSSNVDGGDEINNAYIEKYKKEIKSL